MKPILFNTEMVWAILDGRKTTTRRVIKPQLPSFVLFIEQKADVFKTYMNLGEPCDYPLIKPQYQRGDVLYVQETFGYSKDKYHRRVYKADLEFPQGRPRETLENGKWKSQCAMPRDAARIFLRVTDVRPERLQEINVDGAIAEGAWGGGIPRIPFSLLYKEHPNASCNAVASFAHLWDSDVKKSDRDRYGWDANPWVWVIEFEGSEIP